MNPNDLIQRLVDAIIRQEGMPPDYDNPGNIRNASAWLPAGCAFLGSHNGFWRPGNRKVGIAGLVHLVSLRVAELWTLTQLISSYAPPADNNNTAAYIANVKAWAQIPDENTPLWNYIA